MLILFIKKYLLVFCYLFAAIHSQAQEVKPSHTYSYSPSECKGSNDIYRLNKRISDLALENGLLTIELAVVENCCGIEVGFATIIDDTLWLYAQGESILDTLPSGRIVGEMVVCDCDCCFSLHYELESVHQMPSVVMYNRKQITASEHPYQLVEPKFEVIDGDTINRFDHYGFKQGWHAQFRFDGDTISNLFYANDEAINGLEIRNLNNGVVSFEIWRISSDSLFSISFDSLGVPVEKCWMKERFDFDGPCELIKP